MHKGTEYEVVPNKGAHENKFNLINIWFNPYIFGRRQHTEQRPEREKKDQQRSNLGAKNEVI